ncbi:ATP-binding protein, partial [bacterium]|nr:ATP-binding protein [bacterium]MBU1615586.1 ATP-binding protein [bacterium]
MLKCYGRKKEIQVLELKKEGPALLVYGPPGAGKTTLLRHFYEGLLKREKVVPGYVNLYSGTDPFSRLFAHQLINLFNNLNLKGNKNDLRDLAASIKSYLGEEAQTPVMKNLLLHIRSHLITSGLYEIVRLADVLWDEEDLFELSLDLLFDLKMEAIVKILEAFEMALGDFQLVFILDDFELMSKEREDLFGELLSFRPKKSHFYFSLSKDAFDSLEAKIKEEGSPLELSPLDEKGLSEWINRESPDLLKERSIENIYQTTGGNPFLISEQIKGGLKEEADFDFVGQVLSKYDRKKKYYLSRIALVKGPLSTQEASRLLKIDESMTKLRLFEFAEDSLLRSAYLEREDVFCFDHSLKQERVISILKSEFDITELYQELASYFEGEISYPTEEDMACFFKNFHQTIYYYGKIKDKEKEAKEAYEFYNLLAISLKEKDFCASLTKLTTSPYFIQLETRLKIILYELLSKCKIEEPTLFNETVSKLSRFINERKEDDKFLVEYSKALFYLANWASKKQKIRETNIIILTFSAMISKHPKNEEIKIVFAYLLYNLIYDFSSVYEFGGAKSTLESLRSLMEKNSKVKELRVVYAESLAAISSKLAQDKRFDDLFKYLEILNSLAESKDPEI